MLVECPWNQDLRPVSDRPNSSPASRLSSAGKPTSLITSGCIQDTVNENGAEHDSLRLTPFPLVLDDKHAEKKELHIGDAAPFLPSVAFLTGRHDPSRKKISTFSSTKKVRYHALAISVEIHVNEVVATFAGPTNVAVK
jgi:hypothetical protein